MVRSPESGGCTLKADITWNVYYRFVPEVQGKGFASELARAAITAAGEVGPELPVTALLLEHNRASRAVAEKAGLTLAWRGPDDGNPDPEAIRLVYADRYLAPEIVTTMLNRLSLV